MLVEHITETVQREMGVIVSIASSGVQKAILAAVSKFNVLMVKNGGHIDIHTVWL